MSEGFKTQQECWLALAKGETLINTWNILAKFDANGELVYRENINERPWDCSEYAFTCPSEWSIYKEPPKKTKVTLKRYWCRSEGASEIYTIDSTKDWPEMIMLGSPRLLETEILAEREF